MLFKKPTKKFCAVLKRRYHNREWYRKFGPAIDHYSLTVCYFLGIGVKTALISYTYTEFIKPRIRARMMLIRTPSWLGGTEQFGAHLAIPVLLSPRKKEYKDYTEKKDFETIEYRNSLFEEFRKTDYHMNGPQGYETENYFIDTLYKDLIKKKIDETHFALSIPINFGFDPNFKPDVLKNMSVEYKSRKLVYDFDSQIIPK